MDTRSIVALVIRLVGLFVGISVVLRFFDSAASIAARQAPWSGLLGVILGHGLQFVVAAALYLMPYRIANTIISKAPDIDSPMIGRLERTAIILLGTYLFVRGIDDLLFNVLYFAQTGRAAASDALRGAEGHATFVTSIIEILIALVLVFGARQIWNLLTRTWRKEGLERT